MQLNIGQTGGPAGRDINVVPAWMQGFTGKGVVVGIVDEGKLTEIWDHVSLIPSLPDLFQCTSALKKVREAGDEAIGSCSNTASLQ